VGVHILQRERSLKRWLCGCGAACSRAQRADAIAGGRPRAQARSVPST